MNPDEIMLLRALASRGCRDVADVLRAMARRWSPAYLRTLLRGFVAAGWFEAGSAGDVGTGRLTANGRLAASAYSSGLTE